MTFYIATPNEKYETVNCVHEHFDFDGSSRADSWQPVLVERNVKWNRGRYDLPADMASMTAGDGISLRRSAVEALRDLLEEHGEILPLATEDGVELFAWNITRVIDALDVERSNISRFSDGGIMFVNAPAFHEPMVRSVAYFKLPLRCTRIYLGQRFVDRVEAAGLTGLDFEPVWSPETGPIKRKWP